MRWYRYAINEQMPHTVPRLVDRICSMHADSIEVSHRVYGSPLETDKLAIISRDIKQHYNFVLTTKQVKQDTILNFLGALRCFTMFWLQDMNF